MGFYMWDAYIDIVSFIGLKKISEVIYLTMSDLSVGGVWSKWLYGV